ncbi:hypothetical protein GMORB2_2032, partial [Geosmithia morbida]
MAAAFRPVNEPLASEPAATNKCGADVMTPSPPTPRPSTDPHHQHHHHAAAADDDDRSNSSNLPGDGKTPTRSTFSPGITGQQPLPSSPFSSNNMANTATPKTHNDSHSHAHRRRDSMDVDMDDSDGEGHHDDGAPSDDDSLNADGSKTGRKKKLDNLRQHAQTVHVNEDIPMDSLAATGSRFQRHLRTERVRQAGNRARASKSGSAGGPPRGHSKSLSTSSINSIGSVAPTYSTAADARHRPPPLVMADPRSRPADPYRSSDGHYQYRPPSPSEFGTPTSATFSTGQGSPRWSGMGSPTSSHSRSQSMYSSGARTPGRRLSVPSAVHVFQSPPGPIPARPMFGGSGPMNTSNNGAFASAAPGNIAASPTLGAGMSTRRDSTSSASEDAWRRRTWHPDSRMHAQNQLSNVANQSSMRPNPPPPIANRSNTQSTLQLPGIESFDQPNRHHGGGPMTPPRQHHSPMLLDSQQPRPREMDERRNLNAYDASIQRGLNRLDIGPNTPPRERAAAWLADVSKTHAQLESARTNPSIVRFEGQPPPSYATGPPVSGAGRGRSLHQHTMSAPSMVTSRESKRRGWYNGPLTVHQEEDQQQQQQQQQRPAADPRVAR